VTGDFVLTGLLTPPPAFPETNETGAVMFGDEPTRLPGGASPVDRRTAPLEIGPLAPGQDFGRRYRIIQLLGIGGMGAVYQAWDAELGVAVAIKVIRPEAMSDPAAAADIARRFKQELLLARQVTHKNVVRIHDIGEVDGIKYITMQYVDGEDLATILKREGRLTLAKVLCIARSVTSGLAAAHNAGVVHRDLKPANIMIGAEGEALIMDFGIARSTGDAIDRARIGLVVPADRITPLQRRDGATMAGTVVGTVEYMAPEQARGEPADQRADMYAFGLILYDLLLGRRRATHSISAIDELRSRMQKAPPPARSVISDIPVPLDSLISRCLDPDPAKRYQTAGEVAADLDRLDENGELLPLVRRLTPRLMAATVVLVIAMLGGTYFLTRRAVEPPKQHDPISVVVADLQNTTGDPAFDRTLEPMLQRGLEGAGFISAYDRTRVSARLGVRPPERMDEVAARELALKQGVAVVVSGSIDRQGSGYRVAIKAIETVTGNVITAAVGRAPGKDQVMAAATKLVASVRKALGDDASDSAQIFAMASLSATSLDVVGHYASAREAASNNRFDEAQRSFAKAVELDPKFGLGYQGLAGVALNLGNPQSAEKYAREALRYLDGMTERERYSTRAAFYVMTGDYPQCVKEYTDLIASFPADVAAHNNLALCSTYLRNMPKALSEMRRVVEILPKRALYRVNLALYADYATDFQTGEREARAIQDPDVKGLLALAFAQLGQGQLGQAMETYQKLGTIGTAQGASSAASGLGDLATLEGRFSDAVRILEQGAAEDLASKNAARAAEKFAALAYAESLRGHKRAAMAAVDNALKNGESAKTRFRAAQSFVEVGEVDRARPLIAGLAAELQTEPQAYAKIAEGELVLKTGDPRQAIKILTEANALLDTWIGHFDLGRAYFEAGALTQADSEFERCIKRRGEALSLFMDEVPTYAYLPPVYYYQGRVREGLNNAGFAESYRAYLAVRGASKEDPLLPEVRRRAGRS
jgi:tetratricopeptide (TPR) repeat protein/tRNA A-37 threonylcarbamoyl transferase component Bud32